MSHFPSVRVGEENRRKYSSNGKFQIKQGKYFGEKQRNETDDVVQHLGNMSLVPVPKRKEYEPDLAEIDAFLTSQELEFTPAFKKLRLTLKKCCKVKRYDIIPRELARQLLMDTEKELPSCDKGTTINVDFIDMDDGTNRFFLRCKFQKDRLNLINLTLTDLIRLAKLERVQYHSNVSIIGQAVTVRKRGQDIFVRGWIQGTTHAKADVSLIDYGLVEQCELGSIFKLPDELGETPSLCFPAYLYNFSPDEEGERLGSKIFQQTITEAREIRCQIANLYQSDGQKIYGVRLYALMRDGDNELDIGEYLYDKLDALNDDPAHSMSVRGDMSLMKDLAVLMYSDQEVDILDYAVTENAHCSLKRIFVIKIVSPEHLILQHVAKDGDSHNQSWYDSMQEFYNDPQLSQPFQIKTTQIFKNRCYVWYNQHEKTWNRVRALASELTGTTEGVLVWVLDLGYSTNVNVSEMKEISPKYCLSTALAFRGHLMHIVPTSATGWTDDASNYLKFLCTEGQIFLGVVLERRGLCCNGEMYAFDVSYGLTLAEESDQNRGTVQSRMVMKGFASPSGPCAGRRDLAHMNSPAPVYNRKDFMESLDGNLPSSQGNRTNQNRKIKCSSGFEMKEAIAGWKCANKSSKAVSLKRNWMAAENHVLPSVPFNATGQDRFGPSMYDHIPEIIQNRMGYVTISFEGIGPDNFYIQMQGKWPELDKMMSDLQDMADKMPILLDRVLKPGMVGLARAVDQSKFSYWARVLISSNLIASKSVKAIFVDFGFELAVCMSSLRRLPAYFEEIPPFCSRAHLDFSSVENPFMPSGVVTWTAQSDVVWKDMICEWGKSDPIYYAWQIHSPEQGGLIDLEQFNQRLNFDRRSLKWCVGRRVKNTGHVEIDERRDHPWMKHFYQSIGINIVYEKLENHCNFVTFVPIWKDLLKQGFIVPLVDPKKNPFSLSSRSSDS